VGFSNCGARSVGVASAVMPNLVRSSDVITISHIFIDHLLLSGANLVQIIIDWREWTKPVHGQYDHCWLVPVL